MTTTANASNRGFSLLELLVATALFLIISGVALSLYSSHLPLFSEQQNQAGLNIAMRNTVSQLQLDIANAGSGYYQGINIPDFPISLTVQNNVATTTAPCNTPSTFTYGANCFDQLNIVMVDQKTPPANVDQSGTTCSSTTSSILFANPLSGTTPAQQAAFYHTGDQILVLKSDGTQMTSVVLSKDGKVAGGKVQLQHNPTAGDGSGGDPAYITNNANNKLGTNYCATDWVLKILPISYKVDISTPSDPKLIREQPSGNTANDVVLAEQMIGFKIGALLWNNCTTTCTSDDESTYNYDASSYQSGGAAQGYNYSLVQSVQIELIGRTTPNFAPTYVFRNGFDKGPYQIESASVVINPRNITMNNR
jgi:prepilin-type N-terminal cleavage/methylation domain-containing protein